MPPINAFDLSRLCSCLEHKLTIFQICALSTLLPLLCQADWTGLIARFYIVFPSSAQSSPGLVISHLLSYLLADECECSVWPISPAIVTLQDNERVRVLVSVLD